MYQLGVKGGSHADGLRIHRIASLAHTVAGLAPPVVGRYAETVDRYRLVHHQSHFLLGAQHAEQVFHALLRRQVGVLPIVFLRDGRDVAGVGGAAQQELVDEGQHLGILTFGQLAVSVPVDDAPAHAVADAEAVPHLACGLGRDEHRTVGQPLVIGIAEQQEGTRTYHRTQLVLVVRQTIDAVAVEIRLLALQEPVIVGLVNVFQVLSCQRQFMRGAPGCGTAATRLLGDGQGDALVEGTAVEGHLASVATARQADVLRVNLRHFRTQQLQSVNQTAQSPCPFAVGTVVLQLRVETVERMLTALMVTAKLAVVVHLLLVERHGGDGTVLEQPFGQCYHAGANHHGVRRLAHLRILNLRPQGQAVLADGDGDYQRVAAHAGLHLSGFHGGFCADAVGLYLRGYCVAATLPVGEGADTLQRVGQFADDG